MLIAWIEGFAIFFAVFVVAGVGSWNDWQKEKQFLKLQAESEKDNNVSYSQFLFTNLHLSHLTSHFISFIHIGSRASLPII